MSERPKRKQGAEVPDPEAAEDLEQTRTSILAVDVRRLARPLLPHLTAIAGPHAGETYPLDRDETVLGRGRESTIVIDSDGVSRRHALVRRTGSDCILEDLGSRNGTFVQADGRDDIRVRTRKLVDGDRIQVGTAVVLRFDLLDEREARLQRQLYESAVRDALTGAYNRQHFQERLRAELEHVQLHGGLLSLVILDIDHFKKINDTWGHPAGDAVLRALVAGVGKKTRPDMLFARIGGEEFVILARGLDLPQSVGLAERLREAIADLVIPWKTATIPVTSSLGVAGFSELPPGATGDQLLALADERLYQAKGSGRNRVVGPA